MCIVLWRVVHLNETQPLPAKVRPGLVLASWTFIELIVGSFSLFHLFKELPEASVTAYIADLVLWAGPPASMLLLSTMATTTLHYLLKIKVIR